MRWYEVTLSNGTAFGEVVVVQALDEGHAIEIAVIQGYGLWFNLDELNDDELNEMWWSNDYVYMDLTYYDKGIGLLYIVGASIKELEDL